jgi:hypothetical protein
MDYDMVSDLNEGTPTTIPAETGDASHGKDAVQVNNQAPAREPVSQPKTVDPSVEPTKETSVRDLISSALKASDETPENAQQGDNRPRNPDGTFAQKPIVPEDTAAPVAPPVAAPPGIDPAVFTSLPAETQAQLARTMEDVATQQARFARLAPVEQLIDARKDAWALGGMEPAQALNQLLALSDFAGRDPGGFINYFAQNNGVDLEELVLGLEDEAPVDPQLAALQDEIADLKRFKEGQTQQQQQAAHNARVENVIAFANEKGPDGTVLRPYLSELGDTWLPYISMVMAQNPQWSHTQILQQAYENACWNNPSVRNKLQQATSAAAEAERLRRETARVEAARAASASVRAGTPSSPPTPPDATTRSTRDVIRAAIAQHS